MEFLRAEAFEICFDEFLNYRDQLNRVDYEEFHGWHSLDAIGLRASATRQFIDNAPQVSGEPKRSNVHFQSCCPENHCLPG